MQEQLDLSGDLSFLSLRLFSRIIQFCYNLTIVT